MNRQHAYVVGFLTGLSVFCVALVLFGKDLEVYVGPNFVEIAFDGLQSAISALVGALAMLFSHHDSREF